MTKGVGYGFLREYIIFTPMLISELLKYYLTVMKKHLFIISLLLAAATVKAQLSQVFIVSHDIDQENMMGLDLRSEMIRDGNGILQIGIAGGRMNTTTKLSNIKFGIKLARKDQDGRIVTENSLENGSKVFGPILPSLQREGGDIYLIYFRLEGEDELANLKILAARVDSATLNIGVPKELATIDQKRLGRFSVERFMKNHRLIFRESVDQSSVALVWNSGVDNDISVGLFDNHLVRIWNKRESLKYEDPVELSDVFADDAGKVFLSYKNSLGKEIYEGHLLIVSQNAATIDKNIRIPEGYPWEVRLAPRPSSRLLEVTGTYVGDGEAIDGVFETVLNTDDLTMTQVKVMPVPDDVVESFRKDSWAKNGKKEHGLYPIKMMAFAGSDGSLDLVGEFKRLESGTTHINGFSLSGDVLWVHIVGRKATFGRVPKIRVSTTNLIGNTFSVLAGKNGLVVFYNDTEANLRKDIQDEPSRSDHYNDVVLVAATLGPAGDIKRQKIADLSADHYVAVTEAIQPNDPRGILVLFERINGLGSVVDGSKWMPVDLQ